MYTSSPSYRLSHGSSEGFCSPGGRCLRFDSVAAMVARHQMARGRASEVRGIPEFNIGLAIVDGVGVRCLGR